MELNQIRYFLALAEHLNFTHAANACRVSQPSLTNGIRRLERKLGAPLFSRAPVRLSRLGKKLHPELDAAFAHVRKAHNFVRAQARRERTLEQAVLGSRRLPTANFDLVMRSELRREIVADP